MAVLELSMPLRFVSTSGAALAKTPLVGHYAKAVWFQEWSFGPLFDVATLCGQPVYPSTERSFPCLVPERSVPTETCAHCKRAKPSRRYFALSVDRLVPRSEKVVHPGFDEERWRWRSLTRWDGAMIFAFRTWQEANETAVREDRRLKGPRTARVQALINGAAAISPETMVLQHEEAVAELREADRTWVMWM